MYFTSRNRIISFSAQLLNRHSVGFNAAAFQKTLVWNGGQNFMDSDVFPSLAEWLSWLRLRCLYCLIPAQCRPLCLHLLPLGFPEKHYDVFHFSKTSPGSLIFPKCYFIPTVHPFSTYSQAVFQGPHSLTPWPQSNSLSPWPPPSFFWDSSNRLVSTIVLSVPILALNEYLFLG